jgi:hypothetical protein
LRTPARSRPAPRRVGQRILRPDVLAAAAFEHQLDGQRVAFHFFKVDRGEVGIAQVVAGVLAGERIDRVGAQVRALGCLHHGGLDLLAQLARAPAFGVVHVEDRRAGVLADGRGFGARNLYIFDDGFQRAARR